METKIEKITKEFFKRRFPKKKIAFEKECGYFGEWVGRFKSGRPELHMDEQSLGVWKEMTKELTAKQEDDMLEETRERDFEKKEGSDIPQFLFIKDSLKEIEDNEIYEEPEQCGCGCPDCEIGEIKEKQGKMK